MAVDFPERVVFEDHRVLQASDLEEQRDYHIQRRWQHNLAMHSWGILCGLTIDCEETDPQRPHLEVRPGMALDGYGREIVLTKVVPALRSNQLLDPGVSYDVWIRFREFRNSPSDESSRDDCEGELGAMVRMHDEPEVFVRPTSQRQSGSVKSPSDVPIEDLHFSASQAMKFDSDIIWPVFLGRIERINSVWTLDESERYYGGLIAQRIEFPSDLRDPKSDTKATGSKEFGRTMIINGGDPTDSNLRFAVVELPVTEKDSVPLSVDKYKSPISVRQVDVTVDNSTTQISEVRLKADRIVAEGHLQLKNGAGIKLEPRAVTESTKRAIGWGIFSELQVPSKQDEAFAKVLEFAMPADLAGNNHITFGATNSEGVFKPILSINSDHTVDVFGTLRVHGAIAGTNSEIPFQSGLLVKENTVEIASLVRTLEDSLQTTIVTGVANGAKVELVSKGLEESVNKEEIYPLLINARLQTATDVQKQDIVSACASKVSKQDFIAGLKKNGTPPELVNELLKFSITEAEAGKIATETLGLATDKLNEVLGQLAAAPPFLTNLSKTAKANLVKELSQANASDFATALLSASNASEVVVKLANKSPTQDFVDALLSSSNAKEIITRILKEIQSQDLFDGFKGIEPAKRKPFLENVLKDNASGLSDAIPTDPDGLDNLARSINGANRTAIVRLATALEPPTPPAPA